MRRSSSDLGQSLVVPCQVAMSVTCSTQTIQCTYLLRGILVHNVLTHNLV